MGRTASPTRIESTKPGGFKFRTQASWQEVIGTGGARLGKEVRATVRCLFTFIPAGGGRAWWQAGARPPTKRSGSPPAEGTAPRAHERRRRASVSFTPRQQRDSDDPSRVRVDYLVFKWRSCRWPSRCRVFAGLLAPMPAAHVGRELKPGCFRTPSRNKRAVRAVESAAPRRLFHFRAFGFHSPSGILPLVDIGKDRRYL